jgi:RNA polymerase sigma-70 factor (ECF subfamily)
LDISKLWKEYADYVLKVCLRYVKNIDAAKDIRQEVFFNIIIGKEHFKEESSVKTWLYSIAFNNCMSYFRTIKKQHKIEEFIIKEEILCTENLCLSDSKFPIWAVNKISEMQCPISQLFVELHFGEGWSKKDIGQVFGFSIAKVANRIQKGIEQLRNAI